MRSILLVVMVLTASRSAFAADDAPTAVTVIPAQQPVPCVDLKAEAPKPIYTRWYFWESIGAVVVAGAATAIAVAASNGPRRISASEVCGNTPCSTNIQ